MIAPTKRAVLVLAVGFPVALLPALIDRRLWVLWLALLATALLLLGADLVLGLPNGRLRLAVESPSLLFIGGAEPLVLRVEAVRWRSTVQLDVLPELGETLMPPVPVKLRLSGGQALRHEVLLRPRRRGKARVQAIWLRWCGPLGLIARSRRQPLSVSIPIAPNVRAVRDAALRFFSNREFLAGLKMQHYVGDGSEFESLKEYRPGLDPRAIDWKASARHIKLLVREYRAERNHQVYLAFDTGHLMSEPMEGVPKLDHAINAALLLAYVCVRTGDRVGFFGFDERAGLFVEAQGGVQTVHRLQAQSAELDYSHSETNFTVGLTTLLTRLRRRSLVVVFTDFVDTITAELMVENVHRLARRHLVIFVTFRDRTVDALTQSKPTTLTTLNRSVVATEFARERELVLRRLQRSGVHCIEAPTDQVSVMLINRYLEVKRREMV